MLRTESTPSGHSSSQAERQDRLGALPRDGGVHFHVWAPLADAITLHLETDGRELPLAGDGDGYFSTFVEGVGVGTRYRYRIDDGELFPDPASRYQPEGIHGPSEVIDPGAYTWQDDAWSGLPRERLVFYELHIGTFTPEGTYAAAAERLPYLRDLGITAVEVMPVADFPGRWNWGYDPAALYAPSRAYGRPDDLRAFVDRAHQLGMAVFLDVIYNHLGPDGAYIAAFAPMFTDRHHTPWGQAINLDDEHGDGVRRLFLDNALHWLTEYHFDGLRLDATHALKDDSETHFLAALSDAARALPGPRRYLVAEDPRNLTYVISPRDRGGYGLDAIWTDDFHHIIRHITAGDRDSYYADYVGTTLEDAARVLERGWYYVGQPSLRTGEPRGSDPSSIGTDQCVIAIQNHDQVGNRPEGNRLTDEVDLPTYRAVSALLLFAPELPLLFMGQEWATTSPFLFFTDHNEELGEAVRKGRREEFKDFPGFEGEVPDPQDPATFARSRLAWEETEQMPHAGVLALYRELLALRAELTGPATVVSAEDDAVVVRRGPFVLAVSLAAGRTLTLPDGAEPLLHTDEAAYAPDPHPPEVGGSRVTFARPGALVARAPVS